MSKKQRKAMLGQLRLCIREAEALVHSGNYGPGPSLWDDNPGDTSWGDNTNDNTASADTATFPTGNTLFGGTFRRNWNPTQAAELVQKPMTRRKPHFEQLERFQGLFIDPDRIRCHAYKPAAIFMKACVESNKRRLDDGLKRKSKIFRKTDNLKRLLVEVRARESPLRYYVETVLDEEDSGSS
ncbi:uncharacterized protein BCR38DRAFT_470360 [Pseudomassariella vexata]|uniref:Uncharacterized protein n=1 Tax=Pseudomassariella vexata TaxID=1141098 RepID=A0A1Y2EJF1_9PEZI|nr:uncharacterized protein BCR38DRAFT_470360 [Pseudomassariella vexata]ORY71386.1 hypothetical protein BCR38DRAFT_470360 [Pseudomassariella vexata]